MTIQPISYQPLPENAVCVFRGKIFDVYQWEQEMFDGTKKIFEKLKRPDTVIVFPVDSEGFIYLARQQQPGTREYIGGIGGRAEVGEDPVSVAKRELLEETGMAASEFILLHAEQPVAKIDWSVYFYIAKDVKKVQDIALDWGEKIDLLRYTFAEFLDVAEWDDFTEIEIIPKILKAKIYPEQMKLLRQHFFQK